MAKVLIEASHGTEDPSRAALAFLVAKSAKEQGHDVTIFLTLDATVLIKDGVADSVVGVGPGALKDHLKTVLEHKVPIYV
ncbi:MAG: DsrE family protein [Deltaproteobacteria bacterium]|nr:DsrE family protein [Deltaproteobacteria bacterium]